MSSLKMRIVEIARSFRPPFFFFFDQDLFITTRNWLRISSAKFTGITAAAYNQTQPPFGLIPPMWIAFSRNRISYDLRLVTGHPPILPREIRWPAAEVYHSHRSGLVDLRRDSARPP